MENNMTGTDGKWEFERSSGFAGYRCTKCFTWVYSDAPRLCRCESIIEPTLEFEKSLEEKVMELECHLRKFEVFKDTGVKSVTNNLFKSIYASITELGKHIDAHIDVEAEEMQSLAKSKKQLLQ